MFHEIKLSLKLKYYIFTNRGACFYFNRMKKIIIIKISVRKKGALVTQI